MSPESSYGFKNVWIHASDGTECGDYEITQTVKDGKFVGDAMCYAHEEVCVPLQTKVFEIHGNDGTSAFAHAENLIKRDPQNVVTGSSFTGERCEHGSLLVEVSYYSRDGDG